MLKLANGILDHEGIPYVVKKDGVYVLEEDYSDAIKAIADATN